MINYEELIGEMFQRLLDGRNILPFPELPQDLAYIGFVLDELRDDVRSLEAQIGQL